MISIPISIAAIEPNYNIGISTWSSYPDSIKGFKKALAEQGLIEGNNTTFVIKNAGTNVDRQKEIAKGFESSHLDLVYSLTTPGTVIIKKTLNKDTPIVFSIVTYPADSGLIESFDYSGNNLVGTSNFVPIEHYVNLLLALLPNTKNVAIFHKKGEPNSKTQTVSLTRALKRKNIQVVDIQPSNLSEVDIFARAIIDEVDVFITTTDTLMQNGGEQVLIKLSQEFNIPILSSNKKGIEQGASFGPVADFFVLGEMSGKMAAEILLNKQTTLSISSQLQYSPTILINKKSVESLNITIPPTLPGLVYVQ